MFSSRNFVNNLVHHDQADSYAKEVSNLTFFLVGNIRGPDPLCKSSEQAAGSGPGSGYKSGC